MSTGKGVMAECGISTPASWGADWAAVSAALPFDEESISETIEWLEDNALEGKASRRAPDSGLIKVAGLLKGDLDYYNWGSMIKAAMGAESSEVYTFADELEEIRRIEFEKQISRWRIDSFKVEQMIISGEKGKSLQIEFDLAGRMASRSSTAFPDISISSRSRVKFSTSSTDSLIRIGNQDDALAAGDAVGWESFKFTIKNNLKADDFTNESVYALEPFRNGKRDVSLEINIPRYENDTYIDWQNNKTKLQADLYFTDGSKTFKLEIPEMLILSGFDANIPAGGGLIVQQGTFGCYRNLANTPMTAINDEARITIT